MNLCFFRSYKELMAKCNALGRAEARTQQKFVKAKEKIKNLKVSCFCSLDFSVYTHESYVK